MKIAFITNSRVQCGVAQFGIETLSALRSHSCNEFQEFVVAGENDFRDALPVIAENDMVLVNYHPTTMPYLEKASLKQTGKPTIGIVHEFDALTVNAVHSEIFRYRIAPDPTLSSRIPGLWSVSRIVPQNKVATPHNDIPVIGTFGLITQGKNFEEIITLAERNFKQARLRFHIPNAHYVDADSHLANEVRESIKARCPDKFELEISTDYISSDGLVDFLAANDLNVFLYDRQRGRGISSVPDFAIAAERPMVLSDSAMFRHIRSFAPELFLANSSLRHIMDVGGESCRRLKTLWSPERAAKAYDAIFAEVLEDLSRQQRIKNNTVLTDDMRSALASREIELSVLSPEVFSRKIARTNVQQAFVLDRIEEHASPKSNLLCVGYHEDTAYFALKAKGYSIDAIDPAHDMDLAEFHRRYCGKRYYDVVFSTSVLAHIEDDVEFVSQIKDFLTPGGVAVLTLDFKESYEQGEPIPVTDKRLYTTDRLLGELVPHLHGCKLLDVPDWSEYAPDFEFEDCRYGFASFIFKKAVTQPTPLEAKYERVVIESLLERQIGRLTERCGSLHPRIPKSLPAKKSDSISQLAACIRGLRLLPRDAIRRIRGKN